MLIYVAHGLVLRLPVTSASVRACPDQDEITYRTLFDTPRHSIAPACNYDTPIWQAESTVHRSWKIPPICKEAAVRPIS